MLKFNTYSPEFDRKICGRRGQVVTQALWCSIVVSCRENSVYSKTAQSEKTGVLRALESTGERQAATRVSTAQLAFENSRLECPRGRTV